jgi:hypothetical protein
MLKMRKDFMDGKRNAPVNPIREVTTHPSSEAKDFTDATRIRAFNNLYLLVKASEDLVEDPFNVLGPI